MRKMIEAIPPVHYLARRAYSFYAKNWLKPQIQQRIRTSPRPVRVVIGSSGYFESDWIPTNIDFLNLLVESHWKELFGETQVDVLIAEHVWEHLTPADGVIAARNCFNVLRPGGYLRVAVPDGLSPDPEYIDSVRIGGTGSGAHDHKVLYTYHTFSETFAKAGFEIRLLEYFDEQGQFQEVPWDRSTGLVRRSKRFDPRNQDGVIRYSSIILDAVKPG